MKIRNRLILQRLRDLIFVHYNMRLKLKYINEGKELRQDDLLKDFVYDEKDLILSWIANQKA